MAQPRFRETLDRIAPTINAIMVELKVSKKTAEHLRSGKILPRTSTLRRSKHGPMLMRALADDFEIKQLPTTSDSTIAPAAADANN